MDPDQLASEKPADLNLRCFVKQNISQFSMVRDNVIQVQIIVYTATTTMVIEFLFI